MPHAQETRAPKILTSVPRALQTHDGVTPIVPGAPQASDVVRRIRATQDDVVMPPPAALKPLSAAQKDILEQWIAAGAPYGRHWAFRPAVRPPLPVLRQSSWPRNPVDWFILQRLQAAGLPHGMYKDSTMMQLIYCTFQNVSP